ncbi:MAG: nitroreductase [Planctomycetes bacterium]|nr:nitroreductase [Planctomycetota bacterium]MBM4080044.1 nitroreductase [Planctomycetota bacterium]
MDFYEVIKTRHSVRGFKPDAVETAKLDRVLEAARIAPSAANRQPWQFIVVKSKQVREQLKEAYPQQWFYTAPLIICACAKPDEAWKRGDGKNYVDVDVTIAMDHLILAATAEGLGTCWIGAFKTEAVKRVLNLPAGVEPLAMTPLGYPAAGPRQTSRKELSAILRVIE